MTWKAISLSRPWPHAIVVLGKPLENRQRKDGSMPPICRHRGKLALQAAQSWDADAVDFMVARGLAEAGQVPPNDADHQAGGIVGRCVAVAHVDPHGCVFRGPDDVGAGGRCCTLKNPCDDHLRFDSRWHMPPQYALVLDHVAPTPFIPCVGRLGLWTPPPSVCERLDDLDREVRRA